MNCTLEFDSPVRQHQGAPSAADALVVQFAGHLEEYTYALTEIGDSQHAYVDVQNAVFSLHAPDSGEPLSPMLERVSNIVRLMRIALAETMKEIDRDDKGNCRLARVVLEDSIALVERLHAAYAGLPGSLPDLQGLTANFAGLRYPGETSSSPDHPAPSPATSATTAAYTPAQLREILERIARVMATQNDLLAVLQTNTDEWLGERILDAVQVLAEDVGGMADSAIGGAILGDRDRWSYGRLFADKGRQS